MHSITNAPAEICRMSWFLIEIDDGGCYVERAGNRVSKYAIIHSVDLVDSDSNNMYIDRMVKFRLNNGLAQGKVLLATDDREVVEQRLKALCEEQEANELQVETNRRYLVQYNKSCNSLIHAIVREKDICQTINGSMTNQKVMIKDGKLQRVARVLLSSQYEELIRDELLRLKNHCFEMTFDDADEDIKLPTDAWLLLQYSCSPNDVIYAIVNQTETIWQTENMYPDVVAYISNGVNVFQAIVLRKSTDRSELDSELERIKEFCSNFYQDKQQTNGHGSDKSNSNGSLDDSEEEELHSSVNEKNVLESMEQQMQREAAMIANAFESIDRVRRTMERRLYVLNNP